MEGQEACIGRSGKRFPGCANNKRKGLEVPRNLMCKKIMKKAGCLRCGGTETRSHDNLWLLVEKIVDLYCGEWGGWCNRRGKRRFSSSEKTSWELEWFLVEQMGRFSTDWPHSDRKLTDHDWISSFSHQNGSHFSDPAGNAALSPPRPDLPHFSLDSTSDSWFLFVLSSSPRSSDLCRS